MQTSSLDKHDTDTPPEGMYGFANKICHDDYDRLIKHLETRIERLQDENSQLRWHLQDVRRVLEKVPDNSLPRSVRFKRWGRQTVVELFTRTAPRIAVIWGGAATVAYVVHVIVR